LRIIGQNPVVFFFRHRQSLLIIAFGALILVLIPGIGRVVNGSRRWIQIPGFSLQMSEFTKIPFVIWLASYIHIHYGERELLVQGFLKPIAVCGSLAFLVLCEPDYGTSFLMMAVLLTVLFLSGARIRHVLTFIFVGGATFLGLIALSSNRLNRVMAFFSVEECRFDVSYQLWQGMLCFASGGLWGNGIGLGRQKLFYLPEAHTDFIFPVIGEELGGIFSLMIIFAFLLFAFVALGALQRKTDLFIRALGFGAVLTITFQALINIGVVTGCLPTKGIALPFISYGGSNLITMYALVGLIVNCLKSEKLEERTDHTGYTKAVSLDWLT
jgi:cell division protein FtsW